MCLSTAYQNEIDDGRVLMKNVMTVECRNGAVILTDLFGRRLEISGSLLKASLTDGYVIISPEQ